MVGVTGRSPLLNKEHFARENSIHEIRRRAKLKVLLDNIGCTMLLIYQLRNCSYVASVFQLLER
jgi:hypothetical protein